MDDNESRLAADLPGQDADSAPPGAPIILTSSMRELDTFLGEDSALLRGLLAGMTFAGAPGRR